MPSFDCPICRKVLTVARIEDAPYRPFCSSRCKMIDLGRWLDGTYTVSDSITLADSDLADENAVE